MATRLDPITATVIQSSLVAAADEMFAVLKKTAMSPIIYEVLDVGTGITDPHGELVSSGAGIPTFVGVLDKAVKRIVDLHGLGQYRRRRLLHHQRPLLWRRHSPQRRGHRVARLRGQ